MKKINRLVAVLVFTLLFNLPGNVYGQIFVPIFDPPDKKEAVRVFLDEHPELAAKFYDLISVLNKVETLYIDEKSKEELMNLAMKGLVSGLDSYSNLLIDKEASNAFKSMWGEEKYISVGMSIIKLGRDYIITSVFKDSPAQKMGLEPGDIILKIDGKSVSGLSSYEVTNLIKGEKNTAVLIEIRSKRLQKPKTVRLIRTDVVYLSVATAELGRYGYVKINQFVEETPDRLKEALEQFQGKDGIILDLRDNPGGFVNSVNRIVGMFVGSDKTTVIMRERDGKLLDELQTNVQKEKYPPKVIVLVNNFSASASEILAGTLQYYKVAKIVGVRTFGKAVGQSIVGLANDDADNVRLLLILTTFRYYFPDGKSISDTGVVPDIEVEQPDGFRIYEYGTKKDRQLKEAIKLFKKK